MTATPLRAPFPWFGGKSRIADLVWQRFGRVVNYVEPFCGSAAMLLARPSPIEGVETINDADGYVCNFWRALATVPEEVATWADWPVNENDLHARHAWLTSQRPELVARLEGDPDYCDAKIAGWWVWGISCWIGADWCSGKGPWQVEDGRLVKGAGRAGTERKRPHLGPNSEGKGVHRKLPNLDARGGKGVVASATGGVYHRIPSLVASGKGVSRQRPHLTGQWSGGRGVHGQKGQWLDGWFDALARRLRDVRVCCGDWSRVLTPAVLYRDGITAVLLDPPYSPSERDDVYVEDAAGLAAEVRAWALAHGDDPRLRIALCGYEGEHAMPTTWAKVAWQAHGGYAHIGHGRGRENRARERVWFSPHCRVPEAKQITLWEEDSGL